jgi:hypothetical protein
MHHNEAMHHVVSPLPVVIMAEFKAPGGALGGREERSDVFAAEPRAVGSTLSEGESHAISSPRAASTTSVANGDMADGVSGTRGISGTATTGTNSTGLSKGMSQGNTGISRSGLSNAGATGGGATTGTTG